MANPLFNRIFGCGQPQMPVSPSGQPESGGTGQSAPRMTMEDALREVNEHPAELFEKAHWNVPQECIGNNQATVMHLIRSGQVGGPMMRMIAPMLNKLGVR